MSNVALLKGMSVLVADGRKALLMLNEGVATAPKLKVVSEWKAEPAASTAELGTDKPGRAFATADGRRSAVDQTDWHQMEEDSFVRSVAVHINESVRKGDVTTLVVVAPPRALAVYRDALSSEAKQVLAGEVDKTLTGHPVSDIERILTRA